jgi:hypothetical protein
MTRTVLCVEKREILYLIKQALLNENKKDLPFAIEFVSLELGKDLYQSLCEMIAEGFRTVKKLKNLAAHHQEVHPGTYTGMAHHLVFYQ